jgi:hypothetical protein
LRISAAEDKGANLSLLGVFFGVGALGMPLLLSILSTRFEYPYILSSVGLIMLLAAIYFLTIKFPTAKHEKGLPVKRSPKIIEATCTIINIILPIFSKWRREFN